MEEQKVSKITPASEKSRIFCISNIPPSATKRDIRKIFQKFGSILNLHIPEHLNGRQMGYAFLDIEECIDGTLVAMKSVDFQGRPLIIDEHQQLPVDENQRSLDDRLSEVMDRYSVHVKAPPKLWFSRGH